jgi:diamine N-acetyltransferase
MSGTSRKPRGFIGRIRVDQPYWLDFELRHAGENHEPTSRNLLPDAMYVLGKENRIDMDYVLRELSRSDIGPINEWRNDRNVQRWLVSPFRFVSEEADTRWFDTYLGARANNIRLAICESKLHSIVGVVYLLNIDWISRSCDFGIYVGTTAAQGKGAGKFATSAVLRHAFDDMNLRRIDLSALANNERALRLYRKFGFKEEGRARKAVFKNGEYVDLVRMGILDEDYRQAVLKESAA